MPTTAGSRGGTSNSSVTVTNCKGRDRCSILKPHEIEAPYPRRPSIVAGDFAADAALAAQLRGRLFGFQILLLQGGRRTGQNLGAFIPGRTGSQRGDDPADRWCVRCDLRRHAHRCAASSEDEAQGDSCSGDWRCRGRRRSNHHHDSCFRTQWPQFHGHDDHSDPVVLAAAATPAAPGS